jgi:hypothetical protein
MTSRIINGFLVWTDNSDFLFYTAIVCLNVVPLLLDLDMHPPATAAYVPKMFTDLPLNGDVLAP